MRFEHLKTLVDVDEIPDIGYFIAINKSSEIYIYFEHKFIVERIASKGTCEAIIWDTLFMNKVKYCQYMKYRR